MAIARGGLLAGFVLLFLGSAARAQAPCGSWTAVAMPEAAGKGLAAVSASSPADIWAVWKAIYHWNGSGWSLVPAPGLGNPDTVLVGVAAVDPGNAWVVGYTAFLGTPQTLIERWDGSRWSVVPSPVIAGGSQLDAVDARNADDAWAVGSRAGGLPDYRASRVTLTAHWNGSDWTAVPSPNVSNRSHELLDVEVIASNDVWAVGSYRNIGEDYQTLILHWNGSSWSITPSPNLPGENLLHGVSATSTNDVWAVGEAWDGVTGRQIFLHWDGSSWSQVTGPGGTTVAAGCTGDVLAMGPDDVWAVGSAIGHWNGSQWSLVSGPEVPGAIGFTLRSLARVGACDAWAVGSSYQEDGADDALSTHLTASGGGSGVSVGEAPVGGLALRVSPNPSREESVIDLTLPSADRVQVTILDTSGRRIREVASATLPAGVHAFRWDGRDTSGRAARAGVYFVTVVTGERKIGTRLLRLR